MPAEASFAVAAEMVGRIDRAALAQQRRVTLALARECIAEEPRLPFAEDGSPEQYRGGEAGR
jgi:hypothetical protein